MAGSSAPTFGYVPNVAARVPTAYGRGSTISRAPYFRANTVPAPNRISPCVTVGPSSITSTRFPVITHDRGSRLDQHRTAVGVSDVVPQFLDRPYVGRINLVDHDDVRHPEVRLARVIRQLVAHAQRIGHDDVEIGLVEGQVVVAAVPQHHVRLVFGARQDRRVIHAGVDDGAVDDVRFVFFDLL